MQMLLVTSLGYPAAPVLALKLALSDICICTSYIHFNCQLNIGRVAIPFFVV